MRLRTENKSKQHIAIDVRFVFLIEMEQTANLSVAG